MAKSKPTPASPPPPPPAEPVAYTVVARRYRPQQFSELIGQEHVASALVNALQSGRVAHAYLFTGARGVGKTSAARILAKALNCERGPTPTPCDKCESCLSIATGEDLDVLEIDGASNRKIEDIRDLRQSVKNRPQGRYRIYIIDEVHMLTKEAFNALLKTLEEPPPQVKFIFATTEVDKLPITILSRCQRFDFAHVGPGKIFDQLKRIVEREGHQADEEALKLIARRAAGSMRDSQSLLDQLLASSSGKLTTEHVNAVLGTAGDDRVIDLASAILTGDAKTALDLITAWVERGLQIGELVEQLIEYWRSLMLVNCGGPEVRELPVTPNQQEAILKQAPAVSLDTILAGLEVWTATKTRMRGSTHTQVLLEMAVVRLCNLGELRSVGQLIQALRQPGAPLTVPAATAGTAPPTRTTNVTPPEADRAKKNGPITPRVETTNTHAPSELSTLPLTESTWEEVWARCLRYANEKFPILAKHLNFASSYAICGPNTLVIRFPSSYSQAYDACATDGGIQRIQEALARVTGQAISVRLEKVNEPPLKTEPPPTGQSLAERKKALMALPLLKRASEVLGAQLWHDDGEFNPRAAPNTTPKPNPNTEE
ncbi:MAG: DNA polymerase III subunit gamma/tau [Planctomycetia bacterium]|nr:DNA polymerase III subunit gamma/tau [Planctomycetia bacterium]